MREFSNVAHSGRDRSTPVIGAGEVVTTIQDGMDKILTNPRRVDNCGDDLELATAGWTGESMSNNLPPQARPAGVTLTFGRPLLARLVLFYQSSFFYLRRYNLGTQRHIRRKHALETNQVQTWRGTHAASRYNHSSGDITMCVVPSQSGVFNA